MRQYAGNRIGLAIVGAVLLAIGSYAFLRGTGTIADQPKGARILRAGLAAYLTGHQWIAWTAVLVLTVLTCLTLRWLIKASGWGRIGSHEGTGAALLTVGLKDVEGIGGLRVRVVGRQSLRLAVTCPPAADLGSVVGRLDRDIVGRIRSELGDTEMGTLVRVHVRR